MNENTYGGIFYIAHIDNQQQHNNVFVNFSDRLCLRICHQLNSLTSSKTNYTILKLPPLEPTSSGRKVAIFSFPLLALRGCAFHLRSELITNNIN